MTDENTCVVSSTIPATFTFVNLPADVRERVLSQVAASGVGVRVYATDVGIVAVQVSLRFDTPVRDDNPLADVIEAVRDAAHVPEGT